MKKIVPLLAVLLSSLALLSGCNKSSSGNHSCGGNTCTVGKKSESK